MAKKKKSASPPKAQPAPSPPPPPPAPPKRFASIFPGRPPKGMPGNYHAIPQQLVESVSKLEAELKLPVWLLIQDGRGDRESEFGSESYNLLGDTVASAFFSARHSDLAAGQKIALVIDSNGGMARPTYEMAMLIRRHCGGFVAVIPRHAKSAAALLTLGADEIIMNNHAELGPLDAQFWDPDREERISGLDEVQSLERLEVFALDAVDRMMLMFSRRTRKKARNLLPIVSEFVAKLTKPMFSNIDVVRYTQMSRALKVAEEYGKRLLQKTYGQSAASIAQKLVENYPEHGFPIYPDELRLLGLNVASVPNDTRIILEEMSQCLGGLNVIGKIV